VLSFGLQHEADYYAAALQFEVAAQDFATRFLLHSPLGEVQVMLALAGRHNVRNALAAAAAATSAGATLADVAAGLGSMRSVKGRLQLRRTRAGAWLIDDSYNANPSSVRAGLDVLRSVPGSTWLVLADMAELGNHAADSHAELGRYARECGVKRLFALGPESSRAAETFGSGAEWFPDAETLIRRLQTEMASGVTVLVKGSRVNRLERVVQALGGGG
jgi:UDP-N-acetylmuramoyl-tripeptide--D-alanyl-D-alanine ligase